MSYFNMVCDSCGREVFGCNIVNGMKFCAKCYQETFGETDKDKQIAELQKQLDKHNKYFNSLGCDNFDEFTDFISSFMLTPHEEQILIKDLKQQLKSQPAEIVEKIRNLADEDFDFGTCTCCGEDVHDDVVLTKSDFNKILENCLTVKN